MIKNIWDKVKVWIEKEKYGVITFCSILVILAIPIIIHGLGYAWKELIGGIGSMDGWLSYWGGYLGGIVGMVGVVLTTLFLISIQNKHHQDQLISQNILHEEQLKQQREFLVKSIENSKQIEREKFMIQFNIEKYEKSIVILNNLETKIDNHVQSCNETFEFVFKYFNYKVTTDPIPQEEYEKFSNVVEKHDKNIEELLAELRNLEKIIKPFVYSEIETDTFQYLNSTRLTIFLLNSNRRGEVINNDENIYLNNSRLNIVKSRNLIYDYIKEELGNYNA